MGSSMKKRAMGLLLRQPDMSARDLQEALCCSRATAYTFLNMFKQRQQSDTKRPAGVTKKATTKKAKTPVPEVPSGGAQVLRLVNGKARTPAEALPPDTQDIVVEELLGLMRYVAATRKRMMAEHAKLRPLEHSQFANAIGNTTKAMQTLCDTYPGLAQLTTRKAKDTVGIQDSDLADIDRWMAG